VHAPNFSSDESGLSHDDRGIRFLFRLRLKGKSCNG
jgi:hypothetical protein